MDLHLWGFVANVQGFHFYDERFLYLIYLWTTMLSTGKHVHRKLNRALTQQICIRMSYKTVVLSAGTGLTQCSILLALQKC